MNRLFASDLHLGEPDSAQFEGLTRLLTGTDADEIYLLGDLCEVWVGDDDDGPLARALVELLAATARRAKVYVMHGNRDFLFGETFEHRSRATLIADPHPLEGGLLLSHGDALCVDDADYQQARRLFRSPAWQADVLARPLAARRELARSMREQSRATNANKAENIMDVSTDEVARLMEKYGARTLVHGHTHRPAVHRAPWGTRYVLGAWERCGWSLRQRGTDLELSCFPLTRSST